MFKKITQHGWRYSIAILFNRLIPAWLFRCRRFVIYELDPQLVGNPPKPFIAIGEIPADPSPTQSPATSIDIRWCENEAEIQAVERLTYFTRSPTNGHLQTVRAAIDDELAAGFWTAANHFDELELGLRIMLKPQQCWLFAALVAKQYRRFGIYARILTFIFPELSGQGKSQFLIAVNPDNLASNRIHSRLAQSKMGTVWAIRFYKAAFCFVSGRLEKNKTCAWNSEQFPIEILTKRSH